MFLKLFILAWAGCFAVVAAQPASGTELPPSPEGMSPLQQFRGWLQLSEAEQEKAVADWPEEKRKVLLQKLRAYQVLPPGQRDRRLNMLELRWYLRPLMEMAPADRSAAFSKVPIPIQPMALDRLQAWDQLDPATRADLLENEDTQGLVMSYFAQIRRGIPENQIFGAMDPVKRDRLQAALQKWNRTSVAERRRIGALLATFFEMPREQQSKTISRLSPEEQAEIQRTLQAFAQLPPEQRRVCVNSFQKFANMAPEERQMFLRNAARWQAMTPQERQTWKELVTKLPPMPPEPEILPPMPRASAGSTPQVARNE